jgi:hypothetical protein
MPGSCPMTWHAGKAMSCEETRCWRGVESFPVGTLLGRKTAVRCGLPGSQGNDRAKQFPDTRDDVRATPGFVATDPGVALTSSLADNGRTSRSDVHTTIE